MSSGKPASLSCDASEPLVLVAEWMGDGVPWTRVSSDTSARRRQHTVRVSTAQGTYGMESVRPLRWESGPVTVIAPEEVASIELCTWGGVCVSDGGVFAPEHYRGNTNTTRYLRFHVVSRDDLGREVTGLPEDFDVAFPEPWTKLPVFEGPSRTEWMLTPMGEEVDFGTVVVTAYGKTIEVRIDPTTADRAWAW